MSNKKEHKLTVKVNNRAMRENSVISVEVIRNMKLFLLSATGTLFPFLLFTVKAFFEGVTSKDVFEYWFGRTDIFLAMISILITSISTNLFTERFKWHWITLICMVLIIVFACYVPAITPDKIKSCRVLAAFVVTICLSFFNMIHQISKGSVEHD